MDLDRLAMLAILNDESRSDVRNLITRLVAKPVSEVQGILDESLKRMSEHTLIIATGDLVRQIMKECSSESITRYSRVIGDYLDRGVNVLTFWDDRYPSQLRKIAHPPLILYVRGSRFPGSSRIAMVGTREASEKGIELAFEFARDLADRKKTIVSGLARGIDASAHLGALSAGGTTLAILAGHVDHVFPPQNEPLFQEIVSNGALVSEITSEAMIHKGRFVERNRITSGISDSILIVETGGSGGTLHQAKFALGQNRQVFVVNQGVFHDRRAEEGYNLLLKMGAVGIGSPDEIL